MSIEAALVVWLDRDPDVSAAVGSRVYPDSLPQGASFPAVTYAKLALKSVRSFGGLTGVSMAHLSVSCWGLTKADAKKLATNIRGTKTTPKLDCFQGTVGGVKIQACFCTNEIDLVSPPVHGEGTPVYHTALDFDVTYEDV